MALIIGIDGGGTKTEAVLLDTEDGRVVGWGISGPSNYHNVGMDKTAIHIMDAALKAMEEAGAEPPVDAAAIALAGLDTRLDRRFVVERLETLGIARETIIEHDAHAALMAGSLGAPGVSVIAGTGSIVYGWNNGRRVIAGNHGWILGDQGSGFWIGLEALREAARVLDGRLVAETKIHQVVLREYGASDIDELSYNVYLLGFSVDKIAGLAKHVLMLAEKGDPVAIDIVERNIGELVRAVEVVVERSGLRRPRIYFTGGLFNSPYYTRLFAEKARRHGEPVRLPYKPVMGCLVMAAALIGVEVDWERVARDKRLAINP